MSIQISQEIIKTGIIYRNPSPHIKSVHAYFPSVVVTDNGELLATIVLGEAFEAVNMRTHLARSTDNGETWSLEGPLYPGTEDRVTSDFSRISKLPNGELIVLMMRADRSNYPDEGLTNSKTLGFVPTEFVIFRSADKGYLWTGPKVIDSPLGNTPLELCSPITPLKDGRCLISTSTWRYWDGSIPPGYKMVSLVSSDLGKSWPEYIDVMVDPKQEIQYWESKILEISNDQLLAVAWAYNIVENKDLPNQFALSNDGGKSWSTPQSTGLTGQTLTPFSLDDGRILSIYRRMDKPGLWANISRIESIRWINESTEPLWGHNISGLTITGDNMSENFNVLKFGAPCITRLPDNTIFVAFWGVEDCVSVLRWYKLKLN